MAAEQVLAGTSGDLSAFPSPRAAMIEIKRAFVSEIQEILDPRTQNRELAALIRSTRNASDETRSALQRLAQQDHPDFSDE